MKNTHKNEIKYKIVDLFLILFFLFMRKFLYPKNEINNNKNAIMSIVDKFLTIETKKNNKMQENGYEVRGISV
jgi:hypothetical protein